MFHIIRSQSRERPMGSSFEGLRECSENGWGENPTQGHTWGASPQGTQNLLQTGGIPQGQTLCPSVPAHASLAVVTMPPPASASASAASFCPHSGEWLMYRAPANTRQVIFGRDALGGGVWGQLRGAVGAGGWGSQAQAWCWGGRVCDYLSPT